MWANVHFLEPFKPSVLDFSQPSWRVSKFVLILTCKPRTLGHLCEKSIYCIITELCSDRKILDRICLLLLNMFFSSHQLNFNPICTVTEAGNLACLTFKKPEKPGEYALSTCAIYHTLDFKK